MMTRIGLPLVLLVASLFHTEGFVAPAAIHPAKQATQQQIGWWRQQQQQQQQGLLLQMSSKEEEIAELEAKLRQLKQETQQQQQQAVTAPSTASTKSFKKKEDEEEVPEVPEDIMLSERWKETVDDSSSGGGGASLLVTALGGVALAIGLAFFSQIPVGQEDLNKYTAIETTTQIDLGDLNRARKAGDL